MDEQCPTKSVLVQLKVFLCPWHKGGAHYTLHYTLSLGPVCLSLSPQKSPSRLPRAKRRDRGTIPAQIHTAFSSESDLTWRDWAGPDKAEDARVKRWTVSPIGLSSSADPL